MRLSSKLPGGLDLATGVLFLGGIALIAAAVVGALVMLVPPAAIPPRAVALEPTMVAIPAAPNRPSAALPADRVATILYVDAATGPGGATRSGDHIDVLGFFSRQVTGGEGVTRVVLYDVPVLSVDRSGTSIGLTLSVPGEAALLLHEAQALGARPFVMLRSVHAAPNTDGLPTSFSDADLAARLAGAH